MESTTYSNGNFEGIPSATKWLNDLSSTMMNMYSKQSNLMTNFYSNFFSFFPGNNKNLWNPNVNFLDPLWKNNSLKSFFVPFNSWGTNEPMFNLLTAQFEEAYNQSTAFNDKCAGMLQKKYQNLQTNWGALNEKVQKVLEEEWKTTGGIVNSMVETYNKQNNSSSESNKQLIAEIQNQFALTAKRNENFWAQLIKTTPVDDKPYKENEQKNEHNQNHNHNHGHLKKQSSSRL
jgi:uncharacterized membrane-anchored protein YhcB (DUF1043 family)